MITIRRASADDAAALAAFGERTFTDTFASHNTPEDMQSYVASAFGEQQQHRELTDRDVLALIAEEDGTMLAYAMLRRDGDAVEIVRFYVAREHHGRGLAHSLMTHTIEEAATHFHAARIWLGVWERNPRAIAFYEKCGFRTTGSHPFLLGSDLQTDLIMERSAAIG